MRFEGRTVLVTGAAAGIGRAVALRLAAEGAALVVADRSIESVQDLARSVASSGGEAAAVQYDAASPSSSRDMVDRALAWHGRLDAVLNIAGIYDRQHFGDMALDDWTHMLSVNLTSTMVVAQRALPALIESRGNIVNTGSTAGLDGIAYATAYGASKAAIINLTKSIAAEFAHRGVRANVVCPGRVRTAIGAAVRPLPDLRADLAFHPARLLDMEEGAEPADLAGTYAYLASDDARYVSGSVVLVDGAKSAG